jgi:PAS domain S-box-containing protein
VLGRARWEITGVQLLHTTWEQHRALVEAHLPYHDLQSMRVDGDGVPFVYLTSSGAPVFDGQGRFTGYRGTSRDITAAKLAEQRLRDTQTLLHMAAQIGGFGAWAYNAGDPAVTWSDEVCAIYEVPRGFAPTPDQVVGFFVPEHQEEMRRTMQACLDDGSPFDVEAKAITSKGNELWLRIIGEAEWDAQGEVRRIMGACQDITAGKQAADESRRLAQQLTTTLESLTDGFFTIDPLWHITYANAEIQRLVRKQRSELIGRRLTDVFTDPSAAAFYRHYKRAFQENVVVQGEEYFAPLDAWLHVKAYPSEQGLAVYVRDVTERVLARRELLRLNAELEARVRQRTSQLEAANKELEAFSYSIAHDLRAPLGAIDGFSDCLERTAVADLSERGRHYLSRIRAGVRQMQDLTEGLLSLASLSRASLHNRTVDLTPLARGAIAACREQSPQRVVDIDVAPTLPAFGDPRLLAQVIENLVGNAWKFTARTQRARIEVGSRPGPGGCTVYFVRDNGAGFDPTYAAKLFEPFQRLHTQHEFEGTGIGLAIVHKVVTRHGGRIWAESAPDQGASFFFTLE